MGSNEEQYPAVLMSGGQYAIAEKGATVESVIAKINKAKREGAHLVVLDLWTMDPFIGLEEVPHEETGLVIDDIRIVTTVKKAPEGLARAKGDLVVPTPENVIAMGQQRG